MPLGLIDGFVLGPALGSIEGSLVVGPDEGLSLGSIDGFVLGPILGSIEGSLVDGPDDGLSLGSIDGFVLGPTLGSVEGVVSDGLPSIVIWSTCTSPLSSENILSLN